MLANFQLYIKSFANFLTGTDNLNASNVNKKALLLAMAGPDMVFLFEHIGKVREAMSYDEAIAAVKVGFTGQTNQAISRFKLFTGRAKGNKLFSTW